jgi:hypothetical protein
MSEKRWTYNLSHQHDVLSSHKVHATLNVAVRIAHVDSLNRVLQHQVCWEGDAPEAEREEGKERLEHESGVRLGLLSEPKQRILPEFALLFEGYS